MIERALGLVVRFPRVTLFLILLGTVFFGFHMRDLRLDSTVEDFFIEGDPDKEFFVQVKRVFGHDGVTVIAMVSPAGEDIFSAERLAKLGRLTEELGKIEGVRGVLSLSNAKRIFGSGVSINVQPLVSRIPETAEELAALKTALSENPMYDRNLVSPDRRTAAVNVFLEDFDKKSERYQEIMDRITALLSRESGPEKFYVSGITSTSTAISRAILRDLKRFVPLTFGLIIVILILSFRTPRGVLLPLLTVVLATVWTMGFMGLAGIPIGMVTMVLPPQIIAIGNAYTIYVFSEYLQELTEEGSRFEVVFATLKKAALPLLLCGITTIIGFGSLLWNDIISLRNMGFASMAGVFFSVLLSLTAIPALLVLLRRLPPRRRITESGEERRGMMDQFVEGLVEFNLRHRLPILAGAGLFSLVSALGMFRVEFDTDFLTFFSKDDPVTVANQAQQKYLAGAAPFFVILDAGRADAFKDPALLRRMELFENWMKENIADLDLTLSFLDYLKLLNRVFHKNDPAFYRLPETQAEVAQLLLFYSMSGDPQDFAPYINGDYSMANIMVRSRIVGSTATNQAVSRIEEYAREWFGEPVKVKVSGTIPLVNKSAMAVASGQVQSLMSSVGLIFLVMAILFLSFKVGLIAMVPNLFPILMLFGFMGYARISINLSTALISCIAIGLVVDDTIHILSRYNDELKASLDPDEAMRRTMQAMSKPAIYTSLSLFFGFSILGGSDFVPIRQFGLLTGGTVLVALLGDQVLLPALLSTVRVTTLWDYVGLGLGRQSPRPIRLFQGLSPHQEKIATLMSVFGFHSPGELIVKAGQPVKDLFILLSGRVQKLGGVGGTEVLAEFREGDDFGCLPGEPPFIAPADYVSAEKTKLLVVNPLTLDRLWASNPRITEKIQKNLDQMKCENAAQSETPKIVALSAKAPG